VVNVNTVKGDLLIIIITFNYIHNVRLFKIIN
jgi:hypothetical protein